jgi:hypothetical protein
MGKKNIILFPACLRARSRAFWFIGWDGVDPAHL